MSNPLPPSESPVMARALEIAEAVKEAHLQHGVDPSAAIVQFKDDLQSDPMIDLVCQKANHKIWNELYQTQADKKIKFPLADAETVKSLIGATDALDEKVATAWRQPPEFQNEKVSFDKRGRQLSSYGVPIMTSNPPISVKEASEHAAAVALSRVDAVVDLDRQAEFQKRAALLELAADFKERIKQAADQGEEIFSFANKIAHACEPQNRAHASAIADFCIDGLMAESRITPAQYSKYAEMAKTASVDMTDEGYTLFRGGDSLVIRLNTCLNDGTISGRPEISGHKNSGGPVALEVPYEIEQILRPRQSRPQIQKGNPRMGFGAAPGATNMMKFPA